MPEQKFRWLERKYLFTFFFFGVFFYLLYQFLRILAPFFDAILASATLTLVFFPINAKFRSKMPLRPNASAALSVLSVVTIVVLPLIFMGWLLIRESAEIRRSAGSLLAGIQNSDYSAKPALSPQLDSAWRQLDSIGDSINIDLQQIMLKNLQEMGDKITRSGGQIAKNIVFFVVDLLVLVFALFVFFRDGEKIAGRIIELAPMEKAHKEAIAARLCETIIAVTRGVLLTAAMQGILATAGYAVSKVPVPVFFGVLTSIAALFPFGGTSLVWLPLSIFIFLVKSKAWGIFLLLWGALVVGLLDNIVRPILIGSKARLPIIALFIGLMGGIRVYGFRGVLLGPLLIACVMAFIQIYKKEYQEIKIGEEARQE